MTWVKAFLRTGPSTGPTVLRLVLGGILLMHGIGKLFTGTGLPGYGFSATVGWLHGVVGVPLFFAWAGTLAEATAGTLLVLGLATRGAALLAAIQMTAAAFLGGHAAHGFFANWMGATVEQAGKVAAAPEGFEFHLALVAMSLALVVLGGGLLSLDRQLVRDGHAEATPVIQRLAARRVRLQAVLTWATRHL
jgi:putative oxidoreductase